MGMVSESVAGHGTTEGLAPVGVGAQFVLEGEALPLLKELGQLLSLPFQGLCRWLAVWVFPLGDNGEIGAWVDDFDAVYANTCEADESPICGYDGVRRILEYGLG